MPPPVTFELLVSFSFFVEICGVQKSTSHIKSSESFYKLQHFDNNKKSVRLISVLKLKVTLNIKIYKNQFVEYKLGQLSDFCFIYFKEC